MTRLALRGLVARPMRTVLTVFAVVLGVAMVTAAFCIGDTMGGASDRLADAAYSGTDAVVAAPRAFAASDDPIGSGAAIPASMLQRVRAVPGVGVAVGDLLGDAKVVGTDGKPVGSGPYFGVGFDARTRGADRLSPFELVHGHWAAGPDEVVIDPGAAKKAHVGVGGTVSIDAAGPMRRMRVVGIARFHNVDALGGATAAIFDLRTAQALLHRPGAFDDVLVGAASGTSPAQLRRSLAAQLGPSVHVTTARAQDRFTLTGLGDFVSVVKVILLVFGGICVLVASLTIANTIAITVAQRTRELALLRAQGASRGQVTRGVLTEAGVLGVSGAALGLGAGVALATGLISVLSSMGLDLPRVALAVHARTVVVGVLVGVLATALASLAPALRASRVAPVEALRGTAGAPERRSRKVTVAGAILGVLGVGILALGLFAGGLSTSDRLVSLIPGCLALFVGVALLSPRFVGPLASALGRPSERLGRVAGRLARRNATRNPGRTASTAAALMIGVALVTFVTVLGSGLKTSTDGALRNAIHGDYVVAGHDGWSTIDPGVQGAVARVAGVRAATSIVVGAGRVGNADVTVRGVDPAGSAALWRFDWQHGSQQIVRELGGDGAIVRSDFASKHHLAVGDRFTLRSPAGKQIALVVRGTDRSPAIDPLGLGEITVARAAYDRAFTVQAPMLTLVRVDGGASPAATRALHDALRAFPDAKLSTTGAFVKEQASQIDVLIGISVVLLALALIVSVLGIVNTLALSVLERTREVGLLRAVGMTRRQTRRMVRHEGAITALAGASLGIAVGMFLAGLVTASLSGDGLRFSVPVPMLALFAIIAALAGMAAAALPARRAARLDVLGALAWE